MLRVRQNLHEGLARPAGKLDAGGVTCHGKEVTMTGMARKILMVLIGALLNATRTERE
jgi:hypothetical protein